MACVHCGGRGPFREYSLQSGDREWTFTICRTCCRALGMEDPAGRGAAADAVSPGTGAQGDPGLMAELFWVPMVSIAAGARGPGDLPAPCPVCGSRLEDLMRTGLTGCSGCYRHFARWMESSPVSGDDSPEARLAEALAREDYEEARRLRDRQEGNGPDA